MSFLSKILSGIKWLFSKNHLNQLAATAVTITEIVKGLLSSPVAGFLAELADSITHTGIGEAAVKLANDAIPKILAFELAIEGLPDSPTEADILAFEQRVIAAFGVHDDKSKLFTTLSAQVYGIISNLPDKPTFAQLVAAVELAYQDYVKDTTGIINAPVGTILPNGNIVVQDAAEAKSEQESPNV